MFRFKPMLGFVLAAASLAVISTAASYGSTARPSQTAAARPAQHVLLISVDGLHQSDLRWWIRHHPESVLARIAARARSTRTRPRRSPPTPSRVSSPRSPAATRAPRASITTTATTAACCPPGSSCTPGQTSGLGTEVNFSEVLDRNLNSIDAGAGIPNLYPGLPTSVLALPGRVSQIEQRMIDPGQLPISPATCKPVYPRQYLRVNTIFQVAHDAGMRTAWADKHAAYELISGHTGRAIDDLFTPEINSSTTDPRCRPGPAPIGLRTTATPSSTTRSRCGRS